MDFIDDAARCADGEEDDGDADEGIVEVTSGSEGEQEDENMGIYRPWVAASVVCNT
jgi:hypothetical protein